ncbi:nitrous oxide reductase accessory protein NosL [Natronococcus sp. A-GB7]|uniref:nitrous oxide reductase accessory protein NosL n=1 Tax=Natronococcus sp. A-GB7 TaxID=3037649 RepID=UPI00241FEF9D|nr:nitrous oxide reductase accessory protein NosL [Natronococcus sp. A-GB7]MDG5817361.1 nitrous oxide reductase accessory protein NosL [Natronococcus sp. A-GB7]
MSARDRRSLARRRLLGALSAGACVAVAGCLDGDDDGDDGASGNGDDGDETDDGEHPNAPHLEESGDEPLEFERDQSCVVCAMTPTDYPDWHSQLAHESGERAVFCSSGCMTAYLADVPVDSEIVGAWTVDYETGELIDATEAHFVIVTDEDGVDDEVMGLNPRAFADEDDAVAYLEEWDAEELSEDDIVGFDEIDADVASIYRDGRFPDE